MGNLYLLYRLCIKSFCGDLITKKLYFLIRLQRSSFILVDSVFAKLDFLPPVTVSVALLQWIHAPVRGQVRLINRWDLAIYKEWQLSVSCIMSIYCQYMHILLTQWILFELHIIYFSFVPCIKILWYIFADFSRTIDESGFQKRRAKEGRNDSVYNSQICRI